MTAEDFEGVRKRTSVWFAICTSLNFLLTDIVIYGFIVPVLSTYVSGLIAFHCGFSPRVELVINVLLTFGSIYGTFCLIGEATYWKRLFAFDSFYGSLLRIRDFVNGWVILGCIYFLAATVEIMVNKDKGMKEVQVSEGVLYTVLKAILEFFRMDAAAILTPLGFKPPHKGGIIDPSFGENEKFEHGAIYMLLWAMLTASIAKLVYYNTLFTYLRAMEIFISMRPIFDDDDESHTGSRATVYSKGRVPSRLEEDFVHSVRERNHTGYGSIDD